MKPIVVKPIVVKQSVVKQLKERAFIAIGLALIISLGGPHERRVARATATTEATFTKEISEELEEVQSQLSDLSKFPLFLPADQGRLTAADDRLSATQISTPSFSWIRDQVSDRLGSATLIEQWRAYATPEGFQYVDVVVNEDQWNQLRYFSQYGFILQFGTVAQSNNYQLRVFHSGDATNRTDNIELQSTRNSSAANRAAIRRSINRQSIRLRGSYFCESSSPGSSTLPNCSVFIAI